MSRQLLIIGTAVMTTLFALAMLWEFRIVVVYVLFALALAATIRPLIADMQSHGALMRTTLSVLYLTLLATFIYLIFFVGRYVVIDIQQWTQTLSIQGVWNFPTWMSASLQRTLTDWLPTPDTLFEATVAEPGEFMLPAVLGFTEGLGGVLSALVLVTILGIYWSLNQTQFERLWLSLLPSEERKLARDISHTIEFEVGAYIRSAIFQSLFAMLLLVIGYWVLGSPYAVLLAVFGGLAWWVPFVGVLLALTMTFLVGVFTSMQVGIFTTAYTFIILIVLRWGIEPQIFKRKWENPILTLILILTLANAFGLTGLVIAPILSIIWNILWHFLVRKQLGSEPATQLSDLKERQIRLSNVIDAMPEQPPPLLVSSMERLQTLLKKAEPVVSSEDDF